MRCDLSLVVRFEQLSVRTETDNERASGCYRSRGFEDHGRVTETVEALAVEVQQFSLDLDQLQG
jgi:hypothetical protein